MKQKHIWILLITLFIGLAGCNTAVSPLTDTAQAAIYSAAIRQAVTVDDTHGGSLNPPLIYILTQTDDRVGDPALAQLPAETLPAQMQADIAAALTDLPGQIIWINDRSEVTIDEFSGALVDHGVIITVGNIHPQDDGSVQISASIYVAGLAAGGQTYILEQIDGTWRITGNTGVRWIS